MADILENPVDLIDDAYEQEIQVEQEPIEVVAYRSYNQLDDKPQINGVELVGDKTSSDLGITAQINSAVNSEAQTRQQADSALQGKIDAEELARQQADSTLQGKIDAEETARKAVDKDIQDVLDGETLARQNADTALGGRIDTEIHDRQVADIGLQGQIDAITSKSDVVDVVATYAALQAYDTQHLGDNDVIKVLDDETHGDALTYYRWSKTNQTWSYIGQEAPYYSKSQTETLLLGKQDKIDSTHKLSADLVDDTDAANKFVTAEDKTNWNAKQNALTAGTGIDIENGVVSTPAIVPEVVAELPTTGSEGKLYLTPKAHTSQTATGNPITATISDGAGQIEGFQLDGDTYQQTYTGKNRIGTTNNTASGYGMTVTVDGDIITLDGTNTGTVFNICPAKFNLGGLGGTKPAISILPISGSWTNGSIGFSLRNSSNAQTFFQQEKYDGTLFDSNTLSDSAAESADHAYIFAGATAVCSNFKFRIMMTTATAVETEFEPFVGGQPSPNPSYPQPIQTVTGLQTVEIQGKNLFDYYGLSLSDKFLNANGVMETGTTHYKNQEIAVTGGDTFYWSSEAFGTNGSTYLRLGQFNGNTFISRSLYRSNTSITLNENTTRVVLSVDYEPSIDRYFTKPMFEKGSTSTAYVPYSKQTLQIDLGKNLFNKTAQITDGYSYASDGTLVTVPTCSVQEAYIQVKPNATYTLHTEATSSQTTNFRVYICEYTASKTFIQRDITNPTTANTNTITTTANTHYVRLCFSTVGIDTLQFEAGSIATAYAPYKTPIELCGLGDDGNGNPLYRDYIYPDGGDWKIHKATNTKVYDGTNQGFDWRSNTGTTGKYRFQLAGSEAERSIAQSSSSTYFDGLCNELPVGTRNATFQVAALSGNAIAPRSSSGYGNIGVIYAVAISEMTLEEANTWLATHNMVVTYALETPTDTAIADQALIAQLEAIRTAALQNGANTITNTAAGSNLTGDMEVSYYGYNPTNRYDKFIWLDLNNNYEQIGE